ncbi:hypothetical protein KP509_02G026400 [Ceratopteris richardii]|uniref:Protein kinase domain-containing protein n=1 Tax=Ceratopteris richardii TaxID=49495 RepID=A0A8T2VBS8_CERRI|nr:hypothetical protein KP509_02G026400 [Ceratopteris richardii]
MTSIIRRLLAELLPNLPTPRPPAITLPALPPRPSITLPALPPVYKPPSASKHSAANATGQSDGGPSSHLTLIAVLAVFVTVTALSLVWLLVYLIRRQKKQISQLGKPSNKDSTASLPLWTKEIAKNPRNPLKRWLKVYSESVSFRRFTYSEIQKATDDFSSVIGKGGFGTVYKARFEDGLVAAVKRMSRVSRQREKEFCKEMEFLGRVHHRHLVNLRGFCITKNERFLVYDYMENGSLDEHLRTGDNRTPLSWQSRIQIAIDIAAALEYLHVFCDPPLCHRDIKSSNILLDQHFVAKLADFGLAHATSTAPSTYEQVSTDVRGTPGYLDPEYVITRQLTVKSDIYSYGVLLLELITGRAAVQDNRNLVAWAQPYLSNSDTNSRLVFLVDPALNSSYNTEELRSFARLVRMCTHKEAKSRPSIRQVLAFLYERLDRRSDAAPLPRYSLGNGIMNMEGGQHASSATDLPSSTLPSKPYRFINTCSYN